MSPNQAFRVAGTTIVKYIAVDQVNGHDVIFWEDIERAFPAVNLIQNGGVMINMLRDANGTRYKPFRIKHQPHDILEIVLSTATDDDEGGHTQASETNELIHKSGQELRKEQLPSPIHSKLSSTLQTRSGFENTVIHKLDQLYDQGSVTQQIAVKVLELQKQMNDRLILIQKKTEAILTQQVELAEYPTPRLFIVLPEKPTEYDPANWFRTKFRLHFICECGKHTQPEGSKAIDHLHLAKHEVYMVREPTAFFKKYGPFLMLMLELIKFGSTLAGHVIPALATLNVIELVESVQQSIETVTAGIDYSLECIDKGMEKLRSSSLGELSDTDRNPITHQELANYLRNVEGVEAYLLGSFLKTSNADNILGNLYRMTTAAGYVKWVCRDHYRAGYKEAYIEKLRDIVKLSNGRFNYQLGTVEIALQSSFAAAEFFDALSRAKGVLELMVDFNWKCTRQDIELLRDAIEMSTVGILNVDLQRFQPSLLRTLPFSLSAGYEPLYQILEPVNLKSVHLVLPQDIVKLSNFTPRIPSHLQRLTLELVVGSILSGDEQFGVHSEIPKTNTTAVSCYFSSGENVALAIPEVLKTNLMFTMLDIRDISIGERGARALSEALKTCSTLTTLDMAMNSIGESGAQELSKALKTNTTLTTLYMAGNSIGEKGAHALSEILKTNATLTTLDIGNNSFRKDGAQALSEAIRTNSTLTILKLRNNSIRDHGAQALSVALKINSTLITLDIGGNLIGEKGAQALSETLKTNSTLKALEMWGNSIREKGAQALSEALNTNTALISLNIGGNSIGEKGAKALSAALNTNSTLTTLEIRSNLIEEEGAQALSEALKANSTLTTLNMGNNSIRDKGAQALSLALKTNKTLTTLDIGSSSIEENGAQALSEALKTNSALMTLEMWGNSIGEKGAQALSEALKANKTLTTLDIGNSSIGEKGSQALFEALMTNKTLTSLEIRSNLIGEKGGQALSEVLKINKTLTTVCINYNKIGEKGAQALSEALKTNSALTTLTMCGNSIGEKGMQALSEGLRTNKTLTTLDADE